MPALVDSGADYSIFPLEFAKDLHLTFPQREIWKFAGTTGKTQEAFLETVDMMLFEPAEEEPKLVFEIRAKVAFAKHFVFAGGGLLGQNGFLSQFKAAFNQPEGSFDLERF